MAELILVPQVKPVHGPLWCNGSTPAFGAVEYRFESYGRNLARHTAQPSKESQYVSPENTGPAAVIVLAAGAGTRMKSRTPKILHEIGGLSMVGHALLAARSIHPRQLALVVRHERDRGPDTRRPPHPV